MHLIDKTLKDSMRSIVPDMFNQFLIRYRILQIIDAMEPVGRRILIDTMQTTEREIRNQTSMLKEQHLIEITQKGMICTEKGCAILEQLKPLFQDLSGLAEKEIALSKYLGITKAIIVPGDIEVDSGILTLLGKEAVMLLFEIANRNDDVAITGGSSVASIAQYLTSNKLSSSLRFIAARGSIGEEMKLQANTLVSEFANKAHAKFKTLYFPEHLSENAYEMMLEEAAVKEMIEIYEEIDIVIHGIGTAKNMAKRRNTDASVIDLLKAKEAVGEAFGYYFDEFGQVVHRINTIGIQLEQVKRCQKIIAIAGGTQKAKAIKAYFKNASPNTTLITDEGCANAILNSL